MSGNSRSAKQPDQKQPDLRKRARAFVSALEWPVTPVRAQRRYNLVYTDEVEQERTDRSKENDGAGFGGSPGEGYTNGPQTIVNEPQMEPTETPEMVRDVGSGESGVGPANITGGASATARYAEQLACRLRRADPLPLSIKEFDDAPREVPSELDEQVLLNEYARPDVNEFEDTDVITD